MEQVSPTTAWLLRVAAWRSCSWRRSRQDLFFYEFSLSEPWSVLLGMTEITTEGLIRSQSLCLFPINRQARVWGWLQRANR